MAKSQPKLLSFNGGVVSPLALARQDSRRVSLSAEIQTNVMARRLGPGMLRPGLGFTGAIIPRFTQTTLTVDVGGAKTLASSTGLANDATVYTATLTFAGVITVNISVVGSSSQTYATLLSGIYTDMLASALGGEAITIQLIGGNIVFTMQLRGNSSALTLANSGANHLFTATLTGFVAIGEAVLGTTGNESGQKLIPFIFSKNDTAMVSLVDSEMRVRVDDAYIAPSPHAQTNAVNGHFLYTLDSWTDADDAGCASVFAAGDDGAGYMSLVGTGFNYARRNQQVTVSGGDANKEHQCRIDIARGVVDLRIGTSAGDGTYVSATLTKGSYIFSFTPTGSFYVEFSSATKYASLVDSIYFYNEGLLLETDYIEDTLPLIRHEQSGNVLYLACQDVRPQKIERRAEHSWGIVDYLPGDGPFLPYNSTGITLVSSALSGDVTLTASQALFQSGHVDALFLIDSSGQKVESTLAGEDDWSNEIRVAGTTRSFFAIRASIGTNTVTLQRSIGEPGSWTDVATYTTNATSTVNDGMDNQIVYYRIGIKTGDYTSGSPVVTLEYSEGSISGICRITAVTNGTTATAIVLKEFGGTIATPDWREGAWSTYRGFPSAVALYEGRLWWGGKQFVDGSMSDGYETFDDTLEGAARPIRRSIGFGSADNINWMVGSKTLLISTDTRVLEARSSRDDAPLTQDDFGLKDVSSQGAAKVNQVKIGKDVVYVQNAGVKLIRLWWNGGEYIEDDLTIFSPEIGEPSITRLASQQQPDPRIHCIRSDGVSVVLLFDQAPPEDASQAFIPVETDGDIEDVIILPGDIEDRVYYVPKREIPDGTQSTDADVVRYIEKWALESECQGGALNKQLDSFEIYSGVSTTTITDLHHLEGEAVYARSSAVVQGPYTVTGAQITLGVAVTSAVVGKSYVGLFQSTKLGQLMDKKAIPQVGMIARNVDVRGLEIGQDFDNMVKIPQADWRKTDGVPDSTLIIEDYHEETIPIDSKWTVDSRICLRMTAPYPCTILAAVMNMEGNEK